MAKVHLNYSKNEFMNSTMKEIVDLWKLHGEFNGWKFKKEKNQDRRVYIDQIL
ncbi:hypothetical protein GOQ27_15235 [Clostridium sp. D2Q-11]|uniref:Uncharacterized protein n=1 Tax=Anaeromonas frigoriresistens TaxID=2683708 RepID=A0A942Z8I5_9FIRM|nr:hypothetical protein [Anaeromonas frigoriresistens]MBS4539827.1 hypothetical protein [Anaeromonas frigoriresistens]